MKILCVLSRYAYGQPDRGENYDYAHFVPAFTRLGHEVEVFDCGARDPYADFADMNAALVAKVNAFRPDVMFCVLMHYEIWMETLDLIRARTPIRIINWGTDDSWKFMQASRFFARHVDWHVTTDIAATERAGALGLDNVIASQWAASDQTLLPPLPADQCEYDVSFVGSLYGERASLIDALRKAGIVVRCFGHGSEQGVVAANEIPGIYRRSRISLNFSGAGDKPLFGAPSPHQIKARVFEVTGAGGFLLTEDARGLDRYFQPGEDIAVFRSADQLVERARYYLSNPEARDRVARAGQRQTAERHAYERRFEVSCRGPSRGCVRPMRTGRSISAISPKRRTPPCRVAVIAPDRRNTGRGDGTLIFGYDRGRRAARRLVYELAWRWQGERVLRPAAGPAACFTATS